MTASGSGLRNLEGHTEFDITWPWTRPGGLRPGATAVLRVKDEARSLPWVLPPLLRACDHVLVVDNGSTDGTPEVAAEAAARAGHADKLSQATYPFNVARAGAEHLAQPELSVHSLSYFYNWCFAQVQTRYSWKWDGDMVLTTEGEVSIGDLGWQVGDVQSIIRVPRHGLYLESDSKGYLDLGLRNAEEWGFPIGPDFVFTKAYEWEIRTTPDPVRSIGLPHGLCVELKYLDGDEFAHWTDPTSFATSYRNKRKRREWTVYNALLEGTVLPGVHEITAPAGVHIVDHVTQEWLPRAPRPCSRSGFPSCARALGRPSGPYSRPSPRRKQVGGVVLVTSLRGVRAGNFAVPLSLNTNEVVRYPPRSALGTRRMVGGIGTKEVQMTRMRVGVVGAGRVGAVLGAALRAAGHDVVAAAGESDASQRRIAELLPGVSARQAHPRGARQRPAAARRARRHARERRAGCWPTAAPSTRASTSCTRPAGTAWPCSNPPAGSAPASPRCTRP